MLRDWCDCKHPKGSHHEDMGCVREGCTCKGYRQSKVQYCDASTHPQGAGFHMPGRCTRRASVRRGQKHYCKQHDPVAKTKSNRLKHEKWMRAQGAKEREWAKAAARERHRDLCEKMHTRLLDVLLSLESCEHLGAQACYVFDHLPNSVKLVLRVHRNRAQKKS